MDRFVFEWPVLDEWLRTVFVDDAGQVYLPCGAFGDETTALLCIVHDGVSYVCEDRHIYAPVTWLVKYHQRYASTIEAMATQITRRLPQANCAPAAS